MKLELQPDGTWKKKDKTDDDAYNALFRSYEDSNRRIKELEIQCGHLRLTILKLEALLMQAGTNIAELQAKVTKNEHQRRSDKS